jgi:hypothetical protein
MQILRGIKASSQFHQRGSISKATSRDWRQEGYYFEFLPRILEPPTCFPGDIMHQPVINLTGLMFDLWCNRESCWKGDLNGIWEWAVLKGNVWTTHEKAVVDTVSCFPRSFDHTPQNPAEKISSGYKAWEFLLYFYGLGPGLFYGILPEAYYLHYCKLVIGIRIIYQCQITRHQIKLAHKLLLEWVLEFELLYYKQDIQRLHFIRQCVHAMTHLGPKLIKKGPPSLVAQWTMERIIGHLGMLITQPSNPFANLTELARKIAEINTLIAIWPELETKPKDPHGSIPIGSGYPCSGQRTKNHTTFPLTTMRHSKSSIILFPTQDRFYLLFIGGEDLKFPQNRSHVPIGKRWTALLDQRELIGILRYPIFPHRRLAFDIHR